MKDFPFQNYKNRKEAFSGGKTACNRWIKQWVFINDKGLFIKVSSISGIKSCVPYLR